MSYKVDIYPKTLLEFSNVTFLRGNRPLFEGLSFSLLPGNMLWITGENGIGKTSILKLASGIWSPASGKVRHSLSNQDCEARDIVAYLGHSDAFESLLTAREALEFWAEIYETDDAVSEIFDRIGLTHQQSLRTSALSAGQKRRLAFGRLMITRRPVWILDEPKAALDTRGQSLIENLISEHLLEGGSALVATHDHTRPLGKKAARIKLEPTL